VDSWSNLHLSNQIYWSKKKYSKAIAIISISYFKKQPNFSYFSKLALSQFDIGSLSPNSSNSAALLWFIIKKALKMGKSNTSVIVLFSKVLKPPKIGRQLSKF